MQSLSGLAVYFIVLCISRDWVKCSNHSMDLKSVASLLMQLHAEYCGYSSLCIAGDAHTEPEKANFPLPCCTPCSCSSTCDSTYQYCCPDYMPLRKQQNDTLEVTTTRMLNFDPESHTDLHRDLNVSDVSTKCVRPQVTYKLNHLPDSQAYIMVTSCPRRNQTHSSKIKCEERSNFTNLYDFVPVTSAKTGITYVNKYCLFCNEPIDLLETELLFWKTILVVKGKSFDTTFFESPEAIAAAHLKSINTSYHRRNIHFAPVFPAVADRCEIYDVASCNVTGLWVQYNETLEDVCRFGQSLPIIAEISRNKERKLYKNLACLYCNMDNPFMKKQYPCGYTRAGSNEGYKAGININNVMLTGKPKTMLDSRLSYIDNSTLESLLTLAKTVCDNGYVYLQGACRKIYCPRYHYMKDATCVPLFHVLSGVSINFKIQIIPSDAIGDARDMDEFATQLNFILNSRLNEAVNVNVCHTSLWYVPQSLESYIFNVYLFNPDMVMNFSQVMEEIHAFYCQISSDKNIILSTGLIIGLKYKFQHNVINKLGTLVTGTLNENFLTVVALELLRENGKDMLMCGIPMSVCDINWCYRVTVDLNDTVDIAKRTKQLIHSGKVIYMDQFDYLNQSTLLVCIDLLTSADILQKETKNLTLKSSEYETSNIYEQVGEAWYSTKTAIITYIILAIVVVVVLSRAVRSLIYSRRNEVQPPSEASVTDDNCNELRHNRTRL